MGNCNKSKEEKKDSDIPEGCKPFDLQKALAGEKVVNRSGKEIKGINWTKYPIEDAYRDTYTLRGKLVDGTDSLYDLFMAPKTKTVWINIYKRHNSPYHLTEEEAVIFRFREDYIKTISVEIPNED